MRHPCAGSGIPNAIHARILHVADAAPGQAPAAKAEPSTADMTAKLRRAMIAMKYQGITAEGEHWELYAKPLSPKINDLRNRR